MPRSASSRTMVADLPPSSRKQPLHGGGALLHDPLADRGRAGERDQVDLGRERELLADQVVGRRHDVDDARRGCRSARRRGGRGSVAFHGVSGAGLSTTVLPVASAWPSLFEVTSKGKFHGTMAPTTPTGSRQIRREFERALEVDGVGQHRLPLELVDRAWPARRGRRRAGRRAAGRWSSCGGSPTSRMSCSRSSSCSACSASCSCSRHRLRNAWLVDQSVSSKARRAAVDRPLHVVGRGVGDLAEDLLGGRVDVVERLARIGLDQLAVDEHPLLGVDLHCLTHGRLPLVVRIDPGHERRAVPATTRNATDSCLGSLCSEGI